MSNPRAASGNDAPDPHPEAGAFTAAQVEAMEESRAKEALDAWVSAGQADLVAAVARSSSKTHARLAKRALYQLKSKGVRIPEPSPSAPPLPHPLPQPVEELSAVLSHVLGTGERAFVFAHPIRGGGLEIAQGMLDDTHGILELQLGTINRDGWRRRIRQLAQDRDGGVLIVPWTRMRIELAQACGANQRSGTLLPAEADRLFRRLGIQGEEPEPLPNPLPDDRALTQRAAELHDEPEIAEWLPSEEQLRLLSARVGEVTSSPLVMAEAHRRERLELQIQRTAAELLHGDQRIRYARRLWAMAEVFDGSSRSEAARLARAEARHLFHTSEPSRFAEQLLRKVLKTATTAAAPPATTQSESAEPKRSLILP